MTEAPVLSNVAISRSQISQATYTVITFEASNMTEDDVVYVEIIDQDILTTATSSDYIHYTLRLNGSDLEVMNHATIRITAVNDGFSATDDSLQLTVLATRAIAIARSDVFEVGHDELTLFEAMLKDKYVNHKLDEILKSYQIIRLDYPDEMADYPGIRLYMGGWREAKFGEDVDDQGRPIDEITKVIICEIYMMMNNGLTYNGITYEGAENCITVIRDIIYRIVSEQQGYPNDDIVVADPANVSEFTDIEFDMITPMSEMWQQTYLGMADAVALRLGFAVTYEKVRL